MDASFLQILDKAWVAISGLAIWIWNAQNQRIKDLEDEQKKHEEKHTAIQIEIAKLSSIPETIKEIKDSLGRIEHKLDKKQDKTR